MAVRAISYAIFAIVAVLVNLGIQRLVLTEFVGVSGYVLALVLGTGAGLVVKYMLDKKWIFFDQPQDFRREVGKFSLYTLTGVATTLLFWGTETLFLIVWQTERMREVGAILGLVLGYSIKYRLDLAYVFQVETSKRN
ncbi:GtrA family protein [Ruegeria aquimaris]|uniref:GtrA family protein n=1 Tax=Ruegeria aquimaris TaxID=2984333 RepID=A0ABT3AL79_9RHOB|nr:GtrA family protein [Ruegeria sp. XHP0148]MCV2889421.1 GtrA family protein [Ruegeria sp. XHP0148]